MRLRRNHEARQKGIGGKMARVGFIALVMIFFLLFLINDDTFLRTFYTPSKPKRPAKTEYTRTFEPVSSGQLIQKSYYSVSFNPATKNPDWVAYHMSKADIQDKNYAEPSGFLPDPAIIPDSFSFDSFTESGYEPGQLVPAADMSFDRVAYRETFLRSSIVPQKKGFKPGIWKELEGQTRTRAQHGHDVYVIAGPAYIYPGKTPSLQKSNIAIPSHFYKIILVHHVKKVVMAAFLVPNDTSDKSLSAYRTTVDAIEDVTGIDFFQNMLDDELEEKLESSVDAINFPLDDGLFRQQIEKWNDL